MEWRRQVLRLLVLAASTAAVVAVGFVPTAALPLSQSGVAAAVVPDDGFYWPPLSASADSDASVLMTSKVIGDQFWVRQPNGTSAAGEFEPFGFMAGVNLGSSKAYHDPGEVALTYQDYRRVRARRQAC